MSLSRKVTNFNIGLGANGTTVTVAHGLGETPKVILLLWSGNTAAVESSVQGTYQRGVGWAIGNGAGQMYAFGSTEEHASVLPAAPCRRLAVNDGCIVSITTGGAADGKADVQSWDATNVVFEILDNFAASLRITMIALSGADIQNVAVGTFTSPAATGLVSYTGLGFTPIGGGRTALLLAGDSRLSAFGVAETDSNLSFGVAVSAAQQGVLFSGGRNGGNGVTSNDRRYLRSTEVGVACPINSPNSIDWRGSFNAWVADGFQLNHVEVDAARAFRTAFLVINGPSFAVLNGLIPTVDATSVNLTGAGFQPVAGVALTHAAPESAAGTTDNDEVWSVGVFADNAGIVQHAHEVASDSGVATTAVSTATQDRIMVTQSVSSGALVGYGSVSAVLADGITVTATDGFPTANSLLIALLIGAAPAAGGPTIIPEGLEIGFAVPLGLLGWDIGTPIAAPDDMPIGLVIGNPVVQIQNAPGQEPPPPADPGFSAQTVIEAARDRHQSFDKIRHPNPILLRTLDRAQRVLFGKAVLRYPQLFAASHTFSFPLTEFAAGVSIPFTYTTLLGGNAVLIDGARLSFDIVPYGQREQPVPFYSGWVLGARLYFKGEQADWGGVVGVEVSYVPTIDKLTSLTAVLTLPRTAEDAMVNALAAFMAARGHNDPQLPPVNAAQFIQDAEASEERFLNEVAAQKRSQIKQIREVW